MDGLALSRAYFQDVVEPLLARRFPRLPYAAARLGGGSDVLGFDDGTSQDHDFGLRLTLLVQGDQVDAVTTFLDAELPAEYRGWPTRFATTWAPEPASQTEVRTVREFAFSRLGVDATTDLAIADWLSLTGQSVLEIVAGPVFLDTAGELTHVRRRLDWYPRDLWLHLLACDWAQLGEELPFVGRSGARGDDVGSRVLAARLVHVAMHLGFLLERRWPPYSKWFGTAFAQLPRAAAATHGLRAELAAETWQEREAGLAGALDVLARLQSRVGLPSADPVTIPFFDRPFRGLASIPQVLHDEITDPEVRALPYGIGSIEQISAMTKLLVDGPRRAKVVRSLAERNA